MRPIPMLLVAGLLSGFVGCSDGGPPTPATPAEPASWKPAAPVNVVLILIDTLRADAIVDPEGRYDTPNIDRLGQDGAVFPRAFASAPMTLPSHVSLFSSRPPFETKVLNNWQSVPGELPLLAEWLSEHGYDARAVISLGTLNPPPRGKGVSRGFASYDVDYWCMSQAEFTQARLRASLDARDATKPLFLFAHFSDPHEPYNAHGTEDNKVLLKMDGEPLEELLTSDMSLWSRTVELSEGRTVFEFVPAGEPTWKFRLRQFQCWEGEEELEVTWESMKAMDRVFAARVSVDRGSRAAAPCELKVWINDVPRGDESRRERYALEVAYVDRYVGELVEELKRRNLYEDSLIVFTSDHGEALGEHGGYFGHATGLTDVQIHVPLLVKLPRNDPRGAELAAATQRLATHLDLTPTLLAVAGVPPLPGQRGSPFFDGHGVVHIAQTHKPEATKDQVALRDERFKMIYFADDERFELYDLQADPGETQDVFARLAGERKDWPEQLRKLYVQSEGEFEGAGSDEDLEDRDDMLRALGYGGEDEESEPAPAPPEKGEGR